jgi:two-component system, chemotaxis family, CheB/CheR fusion protein
LSERAPDEQSFDQLLEYLKTNRAFDLTGYKRSTLLRRITRRMQLANIGSFGDYQDYLEVYPDEFTHLFDMVLINVTSFFRDTEAWDALERDIIPVILSGKGDDGPIRVWSAGCSSGEEAFTLAMLLAEKLGNEAFLRRVKIYATDVDNDAITRARLASFSAKEMEPVPEALRKRYFQKNGDRHTFGIDVRRAIIVGRHDLIRDAPISNLDLVVCRNTLIYFNAETQSRILARFHFALNGKGFLFLGKGELLLTHAKLFHPVAPKHRVFSKSDQADLRDRLLATAQAGDPETAAGLAKGLQLGEYAFSVAPVAQIVVANDGTLTLANDRARGMFGLEARDVGRPFKDLELSYRPLELRALMEKAIGERSTAGVNGVERALPGGQTQYLDVHLKPLTSSDGEPLGVSITFEDTTKSHQIEADLQRTSQELETAYEELQSTNEELQTTNEELQSTVEELETANEELQSTNEEHETMNEELRSTNSELQMINVELRTRTEELNRTNTLLETVLASLASGAIAVDRDLNILIWNRRSEDMWGLRSDETIGQPLASLDIGLPISQLIEPLRACIAGASGPRTVGLDATDRRGRRMLCRVTFAPLTKGREAQGAIMLMEDGDRSAESLAAQ